MTREGNLKSGSVGSVGSAELLPAIRDLYSSHPEYVHHEPWELQHVLFSLGYTGDLAPEVEIATAAEVEIATAAEVAQGDYSQWRSAA